ncbi:MAG TPA: hypothetical protein P5186_13025 [Candidatus Paceibacterota bacterium]|nr:hypothetical protein [Verrucomicrobiota bacterium]HRY48963.1 hypothetical protein [Candidatus Paceibacterota bacterium]
MKKRNFTTVRKTVWTLGGWLASGIVLGLLLGCASTKPDLFVQYHNAVRETQSGVDAVLSLNYHWTRSGFIDDFSKDTNSRLSRLMIQPGAGYEWSLPESPVYLEIKRTRSSLAELNEAFANYTSLLARLASRDLVNPAKFEQWTKDLNRSTTDALKALNLDVSSAEISLFSAASSEAARLFIENHRQRHLKDAIEKNQTNVVQYSALCVSLLHTIRGNLKAYYVDQTKPIQEAWNASAGDKRKKNTEAMLNLNEQYADAMRILQELETAYNALPEAHADLARAFMAKPKTTGEGIQRLFSSARRLDHLHQQLQQSGK